MTTVLTIAAYFQGRHHVGCAVHDPTPSACDCRAKGAPLVLLSDAQKVVGQRDDLLSALREIAETSTDPGAVACASAAIAKVGAAS